ncbi:MAG: homoserine O-succinyltransferase [Clostridiales bacterium]|nr:homoserine O-succinyltransferase [Clostridiales bacterium]
MPIKIPNSLPAREILEGENIFVMTEYRAIHQDIRPLKLLILNLMPTKIATETQLLRKFSNTPLQTQVELLQTISHDAQNVDRSHLESFYTSFDQIKDKYYDGLVITGAPVENMDFEEVDYWEELCQIMDWSKSHVHSTLHICWGAQAGLYYHYGIPKYSLPQKVFGVFDHKVLKPSSPLFRGFDDRFYAPHSRHTEVLEQDIRKVPDLEVLAVSEEVGVFAVKTDDSRQFFFLGHLEYDRDTLAQEYWRDVNRGLDIQVPRHYFPGDDPTQTPVVRWRSAGQLIYTNWLNYYVYQTTPYDLTSLKAK